MAWIPGGRFLMGSDHHYPEEAPAHPVWVDGFWIDRHLVTNVQFLRFVKATGYRTQAEQPADPALYPDAPPERLLPASAVFMPPPWPVPTTNHYRWWQSVAGANWRHPEGPGSSIRHRQHHPVVHITHADASAYAAWIGKALPSEAEWERAARGGLEGTEYAWGTELYPGGRAVANTFQGTFPHHNSRLDGYERTSPVGSFPANGYGLFDVIGNVWEWTDDWFEPYVSPQEAKPLRGCCGHSNLPIGNEQGSFERRSQFGTGTHRVIKGGSFLCAPGYCRRYRPAARLAQEIATSTCHLGFRCIVRP